MFGPISFAATVYATERMTTGARLLAKETGMASALKRAYYGFRIARLPWYSFTRLSFVFKKALA